MSGNAMRVPKLGDILPAMSLNIPCIGATTGWREEIEVLGEVVGPFLIHDDIGCTSGYTLTHIGTRRAIQKELETRHRARWLAWKLESLDADWNCDQFAVIRSWSPELLAQISALRADAMSGDLHGTEGGDAG